MPGSRGLIWRRSVVVEDPDPHLRLQADSKTNLRSEAVPSSEPPPRGYYWKWSVHYLISACGFGVSFDKCRALAGKPSRKSSYCPRYITSILIHASSLYIRQVSQLSRCRVHHSDRQIGAEAALGVYSAVHANRSDIQASKRPRPY